jgi:hypothetical protein
VFQRAEDLVGGDVWEAEGGLAGGIQGGVMAPGGFQQDEGADDVGLDEIRRTVD